jgi:hypothetical protein
VTDTRIFRGFDLATGTWTDTVAVGSAALGLILFMLLLVLRRDRDRQRYDNQLAWLRASVYFCVCISLSAATGVTEKLIVEPWGLSDFSSVIWIAATLIYLAIIIYGYWIYWPKGTYTQGRQVYWTFLPFALTLAFCEAQLLLVFWACFETVGLSGIWVALLTFIAGSLSYPWHMHYWDMYVAPAHNILEWNGRKALIVHIPNSTVAILYFAFFESVGIHVLMQGLAFVAACYFMRFPPPWRSEWFGQPIYRSGGRTSEELGPGSD